MTDIKHTPAPWVINYDGGIWTEPTEEDKYSRPICSFRWNSFKEFNEGNNAANARLISAAPELLQALQELTDEAFMNMSGGAGHLIDNAREAITKATREL